MNVKLLPPKEKAIQLIKMFKAIGCVSFESAELNSAKQSAKLCCQQIILENETYYKLIDNRRQLYYKEVIEEINKL